MKGHNSVKSVGGVRVLIRANPLIMLYILAKFCASISKGFRVTHSNSRVDARVVSIYKGA